ncbi:MULTISPECIES: hypothetical protein [Chromobacterium]|uniref:hypothetical protein n=1 Tax=Chromobacterium TaxID=535 RepID=UPI001E62CBE4|nr:MULTISPECIES: hypothetical protein [Chromobacterium]
MRLAWLNLADIIGQLSLQKSLGVFAFHSEQYKIVQRRQHGFPLQRGDLPQMRLNRLLTLLVEVYAFLTQPLLPECIHAVAP